MNLFTNCSFGYISSQYTYSMLCFTFVQHKTEDQNLFSFEFGDFIVKVSWHRSGNFSSFTIIKSYIWKKLLQAETLDIYVWNREKLNTLKRCLFFALNRISKTLVVALFQKNTKKILFANFSLVESKSFSFCMKYFHSVLFKQVIFKKVHVVYLLEICSFY